MHPRVDFVITFPAGNPSDGVIAYTLGMRSHGTNTSCTPVVIAYDGAAAQGTPPRPAPTRHDPTAGRPLANTAHETAAKPTAEPADLATTLQCSASIALNTSCSASSVAGWIIAAIVCGIFVFMVVLVLVIVCCTRRRKGAQPYNGGGDGNANYDDSSNNANYAMSDTNYSDPAPVSVTVSTD